MAQNFVQIPCGKCGTTVWISPAAGVGYCPSCHTPNQLPPGAAAGAAAPAPGGYGAPGAAPGGFGPPPAAPGGFGPAPAAPGGYGAPGGAAPYGAPAAGAPGAYVPPPVTPPGAPAANPYGAAAPMGMAGVPMKAPGLPIMKIVSAVGLAVLIGGAYIVKSFVLDKLKGGHDSLSSVGISDAKKAEPDKMILATAPLAKKWRSDAAFLGVNILGLGPDGTVDLTKTNVVIEYFSPSRVTLASAKSREDAVKKFNFNDNGVTYKDKYNATNQWKDAHETPMPGCTVKQVAAKLAALGLKPGQTAHLSLDPNFGTVWHAMAESPKIDVRYDIGTCAERK